MKSMLTHYKKSAERRKLPFTLTESEFEELTKKNCDYCGEPPELRAYSPSQKARPVMGIDRVDSSKGYESDNCVPCCKECNFLKSNLPLDSFLKRVEMIYLRRVKV